MTGCILTYVNSSRQPIQNGWGTERDINCALGWTASRPWCTAFTTWSKRSTALQTHTDPCWRITTLTVACGWAVVSADWTTISHTRCWSVVNLHSSTWLRSSSWLDPQCRFQELLISILPPTWFITICISKKSNPPFTRASMHQLFNPAEVILTSSEKSKY